MTPPDQSQDPRVKNGRYVVAYADWLRENPTPIQEAVLGETERVAVRLEAAMAEWAEGGTRPAVSREAVREALRQEVAAYGPEELRLPATPSNSGLLARRWLERELAVLRREAAEQAQQRQARMMELSGGAQPFLLEPGRLPPQGLPASLSFVPVNDRAGQRAPPPAATETFALSTAPPADPLPACLRQAPRRPAS